MTIDDADLFDLAVWISWKKHMIALSLDELGFRKRRGLRTAMLYALAATIGFKLGGKKNESFLSNNRELYDIYFIVSISQGHVEH